MKQRRHRSASVLLLTVVLLVLFGFVMMASISAPYSMQKNGNFHHYALRQGVWLVLGTGAALIARRIDYHFWVKRRFVLFAFTVTTVLLALCYKKIMGRPIPNPFGVELNGSQRWVQIPGVSFAGIQPSEFAKFTLIAFLAWWHSEKHPHWPGFVKGIVFPIGLSCIILGLVAFEVDMGTTMLLGCTAVAMTFAAGAPYALVFGIGGLGFALLALAVSFSSNRMQRVLAFLDPFKDAQGKGYQLINALSGFVAGGAWGLGLGLGIQKQRGYLPEAHTDFILASIGEELGVLATFAFLAMFVVLMVCSYRIAARAADRAGQLIAVGIASLVSIQAVVNVAVVTGCAPTKGLALPFVSYSGSSVLVLLFMMGVLLNIAHLSEVAASQARPD